MAPSHRRALPQLRLRQTIRLSVRLLLNRLRILLKKKTKVRLKKLKIILNGWKVCFRMRTVFSALIMRLHLKRRKRRKRKKIKINLKKITTILSFCMMTTLKRATIAQNLKFKPLKLQKIMRLHLVMMKTWEFISPCLSSRNGNIIPLPRLTAIIIKNGNTVKILLLNQMNKLGSM